MTIQQLYYFEQVAKYGSYTKAAEALFVSQPALSYAIGELEKELRVPLFQKKGRYISLTKYGKLFLVHTQNVLQELDLARQNIDSLINPDRGHITISHISSMNATFIPDIIREFYLTPANKSVQFSFLEQPTTAITESIRMGRCDIGFGSKPDDAAISCFPVYSEELVLIVSKDHPLVIYDEIDLPDTIEYGFIAYDKQCGIRKEIDMLYRLLGIQQKILCEVVDNIMVAGLVSAGVGLGIVPKMYGTPSYNVKSLRIRNNNVSRILYMLWSEDNFQSPAMIKFRDFVKTSHETKTNGQK